MGKPNKGNKPRPGQPGAPVYSPGAMELRALLRRVPDGFQATLNSLAGRAGEERERLMAELARGMGKDVLPLVRAAALGQNDGLALSALKVLPVLGTRAAADVLVEAMGRNPGTERTRVARQAALALQARGIRIDIPAADEPDPPRLSLRETFVSAPDGSGARTVAARLQDQHGVWHAVFVLWNDRVGVKDGFLRPMSRQEWTEKMAQVEEIGRGWVACPADYSRWLVAQARAGTVDLNEEHVKSWDEWIGAAPEGYAAPDPLAPARSATAEQRAEWLSGSAELVRLPDLQRWSLEPEECSEWVKPWSDLQNRMRLRGETDALREERQDLVRRAATVLIDPEERRLYQGRLVELARVYEWREPTAQWLPHARRAAAAALAIEEGVATGDHPFLLALVERSLQVADRLQRQPNLAKQYRRRYR